MIVPVVPLVATARKELAFGCDPEGVSRGNFDRDEILLAISEKGSGKRSKVADYRFTNRGGKGVKTIEVTEKTGDLIAIMSAGAYGAVLVLAALSVAAGAACRPASA